MDGDVGQGRSTRQLRRFVGLVVVAVVAVAACQTGVWSGPSSGAKVSVIGDSLIHHAEGNYDGAPYRRLLADELVAAGYRSHVSGYVGESIEAGHRELWPLVADEPDLDTLVIALGTNDAHNGVPLDVSRAAMRGWLEEASGLRCIALIGLNVHATKWQFDVLAPPFNAMLAEEAARVDNAIVVEWDPGELQEADGNVHMPTAEGQARYRATILDAVDRCAQRGPTPTTTTTTVEEPTTTTTELPEPTTTTTLVEEPTTTTTEAESPTTTEAPPTTVEGLAP